MESNVNFKFTVTPSNRTILKNVFWVNREKSMPVIKVVNLELFSNAIVLYIINSEKKESLSNSYQLGDLNFEIFKMGNKVFDGLKIYDDMYFIALKDEMEKIRSTDTSDFRMYSDRTCVETDYQGTSLNEADELTANVIMKLTVDIKEEFLNAFGFPKQIDISNVKRVVFRDAYYIDTMFSKNINACNVEFFQNGYRRFEGNGLTQSMSPDYLVNEYELISMKSGEYTTFVYKTRRRIDSPDNASNVFFLLKSEDAKKVQDLDTIKKDLYKLVENEDMAASDYAYEGRSLELEMEYASRLLTSLSSDIKNEFLRMPEEFEKIKQERERARREQVRARQELESKKQKVAMLPRYQEELKIAETNLEDTKKRKGLFVGKKVREAEQKVKELQDYIASLEEIKASIKSIESESRSEASTVSATPIPADKETVSMTDDEKGSGDVSFPLTNDQDRKEIPNDENKEVTIEGSEIIEILAQMGLGGQGAEKEDWIKTQKTFNLIGEGDNYFSEGKNKEAYESLSTAINFNPGEPTVYIRRALAAYNLEDLNHTLADLLSAIAIEPYHARLSFLRGVISLLAGKDNDALDDFVEGIHAQLNQAFDRSVLGKLRWTNNQLEIAIRNFAKEITIEGDDARQNLIKGVLAMLAKSNDFFQTPPGFEEPLDRFTRVIQLDPDCISAYWLRGICQDDPKEAVKDFKKAINLTGDKAEYYFLCGFNNMLAGDMGSGKVDFLEAIRLDPNNGEYQEKLGVFLTKYADYKTAIVYLSNAIAMNLEDIYAYYYRGISYQWINDTQAALADFQMVIDLEEKLGNVKIEDVQSKIEEIKKIEELKESLQAKKNSKFNTLQTAKDYMERGESLLHASDWANAYLDFEEAIRLEPENSNAYRYRGLTSYKMGDTKSAIKDYNQAIILDPNESKLFLNRGILRAELGYIENAIKDFTEAIRLDPKDHRAYHMRAKAHSEFWFESNGIDLALEDYEQAIQLDPNDPEIYISRAKLWMEGMFINGDKNALKDYDEAIRLDPQRVDFYLTRGKVKNDLGDKTGAIEDLMQAQELDPNNEQVNDLVKLLSGYAEKSGDNDQSTEENDDEGEWVAVDASMDEGEDEDDDNSQSFSVTVEFNENITEDHQDYDPVNARSYNYKGAEDLQNENYESALKNFTRGIHLNPKDSDPYFFRASSFLQLKNYDPALDDLTSYIRLRPGNLNPLFPQAILMACIGNRDMDRAIQIFTEAIGYYPAVVNLYFYRGQVFRILENWDAAISDLNQAIVLDPEQPDYYLERAVDYEYIGKIIFAISDYQMYQELSKSTDPDKQYLRICSNENDAPDPIEKILELRKKIDTNEGSKERAELIAEPKKIELANMHLLKGSKYKESNVIDKALQEYQIGMNIAPNYALPYNLMFVLYHDKQDWEKAFTYISEVIRINPENAEAYQNRGSVLFQTGKIEDAIKDFQSAIKYKPDYANAYQDLGAAFIQKQEYDSAIENLTQAISLDQDIPLAYVYRGYASYLKGDNRSAAVDWKKYCELGGDPTYALSIQQIQEYIKALEGQG